MIRRGLLLSSSGPRVVLSLAVVAIVLGALVRLAWPWGAEPSDNDRRLLPTDRRGVYITANFAGRPDKMFALSESLLASGLNTVVVDVKDNGGTVAYDTQVPTARAIGARAVRYDLAQLVGDLQQRGIYVIARHVVFYDPVFAKSVKSPHTPWVLPSDLRAVAYNLDLAAEVAHSGVDEIQFDYIRWPDGDPLGRDYSARSESITAFLQEAQQRVRSRVYLSADVFGRALWPWNQKNIDPIGQQLEQMSAFVDWLSPMVYPSHYENKTFWDNPYATVKRALGEGLRRELRMRPFLQAFAMKIPNGMGLEDYIRAQVRAVDELGVDTYLFWNPQGNYAALWKALGNRAAR